MSHCGAQDVGQEAGHVEAEGAGGGSRIMMGGASV